MDELEKLNISQDNTYINDIYDNYDDYSEYNLKILIKYNLKIIFVKILAFVFFIIIIRLLLHKKNVKDFLFLTSLITRKNITKIKSIIKFLKENEEYMKYQNKKFYFKGNFALNYSYLLSKVEIVKPDKKRIGVVGVENDQNPGNNLIKYSMFTKLKEYGFDPIIISRTKKNNSTDFLQRTVKLKSIKRFSELNKLDYDILMVNSDLSWTFSEKKYFYDNAFLRFAEKWDIPKFIYGASMGTIKWFYTKTDNNIAKRLLKKFTGISLREIGTVKLAEKNLGIKPTFVLDPTFLLEKEYYLDIIKNYKQDFNFNKKYLMIYQLDKNNIIKQFIIKACSQLNFTIYEVSQNNKYYVENFIFGINISQAVISDSYHGTIFSIIFNKPFISFVNFNRGGQRFISLRQTFNLYNRIIYSNESIGNVSLLSEPLKINRTLLKELKNTSINFLKKNLGLL